MGRWWLNSLLVLSACTPPSADPTLEITVAPSTLDALGRTGRVRVVATNGDGTLGQGALTLETSPGELDATTLEFDAYGTSTTTLTCAAADTACAEGARISLSARWTLPDGGIVRNTKSLAIGQPGVGTQPTTWSPASCPPEAKLVYLFTDSATLFSFYPPTRSLVALGPLQCPAAPGATPNSMAVSQDATAWVGYSDGSMFRVNVRTRSCTATAFTPPSGWTSYGMGFAPVSDSSPVETLYLASAQGLAQVNLQTMKATTVGPFSGPFAGRGAELTGTSAGGLYGFFLPASTGGGMQLGHLTKSNADSTLAKDFPTLTLGTSSFAYAFSSWGPDFYLYTSAAGAPTTVTKYSPANDSVVTYMTAPAGVRILGAGVSRCGAD